MPSYICGNDGKTVSFNAAFSSGSLASVSVSTVTVCFITKNSSGGFFDEIPWNWILIGVAGVELMVIVIMAVVKKRK